MPLFKKLDESLIDEEYERLEALLECEGQARDRLRCSWCIPPATAALPVSAVGQAAAAALVHDEEA
jgi:hypothetical protein